MINYFIYKVGIVWIENITWIVLYFFRSWKQEKPSEESGGFSIKFDLQYYYYLF